MSSSVSVSYTHLDVYTRQVPKSITIPSGLTVERPVDEGIDLTWNAIDGEGVKYNVYRQIDGGDVQKIETGLSETT